MEFANFVYGTESDEDSYPYNSCHMPCDPNIEQDEDDSEDYPRVFYQVPPSKRSSKALSEESLALEARLEKFRQRVNIKQEKKTSLDVQGDVPDLNIAFRKIHKLTVKADDVRECCYVPDRDLLILTLNDAKTVRFYSTKSFKAVMMKKCKRRLNVVRYNEEGDKVFFAGDDYYVEIFNLKTLQSEVTSTLLEGWSITEAVYLKKQQAVAVGMCPSIVDILSASTLNRLSRFEVDNTYSIINEVLCLHSNFLLIVSRVITDFTPVKKISVYNYRTKDMIDSTALKVCASSYVGVTTKSPLNIVTCLGILPGEAPVREGGFRLVQLILNTKEKSLVIHKVGPTNMEFEELSRIQNSDYYIVKTVESSGSRTLLMKITGDKAQLMRVMVGSDCSIFKTHLFAKLKEPSLIVGADKAGSLCVYSFLRKRSKVQKSVENKEKNENSQ